MRCQERLREHSLGVVRAPLNSKDELVIVRLGLEWKGDRGPLRQRGCNKEEKQAAEQGL